MDKKQTYLLGFAGLRIQLRIPLNVNLPEELLAFWCEDNGKYDAEYDIQLLERPLDLPIKSVASCGGMRIYPYKNGQLRVFSTLTEKDGCQVACYTNKEKRNILYYPASKWAFYSKELHLLHLIGIEEFLLRHEAFLLHSSVIQVNNQAVLFSGPSGVGKSTQASLWKQYLGADILNGDRCIVRKVDDTFYGCGSPWCGTSGIYRKEKAPVRGVFILKQAKENSVRRLKAEAFVNIFQQTIVNAWDSEFVTKLTDLIEELLKQVPVYELACRPDETAVQLAYDTLFKGGI